MTNLNQKIERLKEVYFHNCTIFYSEDGEYVNTIDFDNNMVYYVKYVEQSCGCCSYPEDCELELTHFIEYMTDEGFEDMIQHYIHYKK